jgi:hypothetical protein
MAQAAESSGLPVLRVNWYDSGGARGGTPDREQEQIGLLPRVKLRLGRLSHAGEQKGVDLKIGLDLVTHARNNAVDVMFLLSGDDDLTEAVEEAQSHGIEVVLLAVPVISGKPHAVSKHLLRAADRLELISEAAIDSSVTVYVREMFGPPAALHGHDPAVPAEPAEAVGPTAPAPAAEGRPQPAARVTEVTEAEVPAEETAAAYPSMPTPAVMPRKIPGPAASTPPLRPAPVLVHRSVTGRATGGWFETIDPDEEERLVDEVCSGVLDMWLKRASEQERSGLLDNEPTIPGDIDRALLTDLSTRSNSYALDEPTRHILRSRFWAVARHKLGLPREEQKISQ